MATSSMIIERDTLAARLRRARERTDEIFALLEPEALYERPIPERHRLVFYLGHVEAFDWNLVARQAYGVPSFNDRFDRLFAFGIDPIDGGLPNELPSDWPRRPEIESYNAQVRDVVDACLAGERPLRPETDVPTVFNMAIEHRLMHAETLAYLIHQLPPAAKRAVASKRHADAAARAPRGTARIPAGAATLGRARADSGFGWDNEFERHTVQVPAFSIDRDKITNGRFLEFVDDGGYRTPRHWTDRDRTWISSRRIDRPHFWRNADGEWRYRGMFGEVPLPLGAPVYVSHAEASAFARWAGGALPSEPQFHRAAYGTPQGEEREYPWGAEAPDPRRGNFDFSQWDPSPIGAHPDGDSAFGVSELVGNGWEWTSTPFAPFEGFRSHPWYEGYSANFFDGEHYVMKGGSPRTAACMLRRSFRNWFQPHYSYAYATFRLVAP